MASKLFGGISLGEVANSVKDRAAPSPFTNPTSAKPVLPAAELALSGRTAPLVERETFFSVDPKRVRGWKYHNRTGAWYTKEDCQDLIDSIAKGEQQEAALGRRLSGDPNFDYELIYGMRRRFACEHLNKKLKLRVTDADDTRAAVLMHAENMDRKDITPMERAISFLTQMEAKLFATQDALAEAMSLSKAQVAKMLRAAQLLRINPIGSLLPEHRQIPVEQAYKLSGLLERPGAKEVIMQAAQNLARKKDTTRSPADVLRTLIASLDRSKKFEPIQKAFNLGPSKRLTVTRNPKGKVTISFPEGALNAAAKSEILAAMSQIVDELG